MPDIYQKINAIMADMPAIGKNQKNQQQGFKYRGIDDVMNALNPLLVKHGVFLAPEVLDRKREERATKSGGVIAFTVLTVRYTFYAASDGSSLSAVVTGEGMDSADKSTNKALAGAMKYALFQLLCIPTEEMIDGDSETPPGPAPKDEKKSAETDPMAAKQAAEDARILKARKEELHHLAVKYGIEDKGISSTMKELEDENYIKVKKLYAYSPNEYHDLLICIEQRLKDLGYTEREAS